jgi:hypothetical protein
MPSVDQLKSRLEALLAKIGADGLARERKQIARAGSQTELRLLGTGLRDILSKRFGERWSNEVDAVFGRSTTIQDAPPSMPPSTMPSTLPPALPVVDHGPSSEMGPHAPTRFGTQETYAAIKQQGPQERIESLRAYLIHAAQELLADKSAPMQERIAGARSLNELRGVVRAMTEIARLTHSEVTVERFSSKVHALFIAVESGPTQH